MSLEGSTSTLLLKVVVDAGRARGLDVGRALALAAIDVDVLADPVARVPRSVGRALWAELARQSGDADFGLHLAVEETAQRAMGVIEYAARTSATLGDAYARVAELLRLAIEPAEARFSVERSVGWLTFRVGDRATLADRHAAEFSVAWMLLAGRQATGKPLVPAAVAFEHHAPTNVREHVRVLGVSPRFGAPSSGFALRAVDLALPLSASDPQLHAIVTTYASDLLSKVPVSDDLPASVRRDIVASLESGDAAESAVVARVARKARMSARTLQRRLAERGTSVRRLLGEARAELALVWLLEPGATVGTVAARLGFADQAALTRAFRRWTGEVPVAYVRRSVPKAELAPSDKTMA